MKRLPQMIVRIWLLPLLISASNTFAVIRDGGIDPANLGKGDWIYSIQDATNKLGGHVTSVTNENSLMLFYKSVGIRYVIVKTGTGTSLYNACYGFPQLTSNFVNVAHSNNILVFGYNRSFATNTAGEVAIADFVFNHGGDGFVWDAEAEWESSIAGVGTNGPSLAWAQCSQVRSNWPNKFLAHAPFPIIYFHSSFPYKEFGFWCDAVMPQIYHLSTAGLKSSPSATINWTDVNWKTWQDSLSGLSPSFLDGLTVYWTNAIKPIYPLQDVYGPAIVGGLICNATSTAVPDEDVTEFIDYCMADPHAQTVGGFKSINFWRADLHSSAQWTNIKAGTVGDFAGVVNNIVMDDSSATYVGGWTHVRVFGSTTTLPVYYGTTGSDTNSFGTNYFSKVQGAGSSYAQFTPNIVTPGDYDVYQWHPFITNASSGTPFIITHALGSTTVLANQQTNSGNWSLLGRFNFTAGTSGNIRVRDDFADAGNLAIADGLKLIFAGTNPPSAPTISVQPANTNVVAGQNATFLVTANGTAPLAYQWRSNNVDIAAATNSSLTLLAVQTNAAANYSVLITNAIGSITSSNALLTVNYSLSSTVIGSGTIVPSPSQSSYTPGATVLLAATPNAGNTFTGWSGDASGTNNPINIAMATNRAVTATFVNTNTDIFLDNTNPEVTFVGSWTLGTTAAGRYLADYRFATATAGGTGTATYRPNIGKAGYYSVAIQYPAGANRAINSPWFISYQGGSTNVLVNQQSNGGIWLQLAASCPFAAGTNGYIQVSNNAGPVANVVMADGVRLTYVAPFNTAPTISTQPQSQSVKLGSNVPFSVATSGTPTPGYQWQFNGSPISGATASTYIRSNAQFADAGNYSVLVTNVAGSLVSSNAALTVLPLAPMWFQAITPLPDGRMTLIVTGEPGYAYSVDRSTNLALWQQITNLMNTNGTSAFTDDAATNASAGFYRTRQ